MSITIYEIIPPPAPISNNTTFLVHEHSRKEIGQPL